MTTYYVIQPTLTDAQIELVNTTGRWDSCPEAKHYLRMTAPARGDIAPEWILNAITCGVFAKGWTVEADNPETVFTLANYMDSRSPGRVIAKAPDAKSMSVGDLLVWQDADGKAHAQRCASFGFSPMHSLIAVCALRVATE